MFSPFAARTAAWLGVFLCLFGQARAADGLLDIHARAMEQDPRLNIARHRLDMGEAQKNIARGGLFPQVVAQAQVSENEITRTGLGGGTDEYPGERYSVQVRQMLLNWRSLAAHDRSQAVLDQREQELLDTMAQLSLDVTQRYFDVLLADDNVELLSREKDLLEEQVSQIRALYDRRLAPITDVLETQARADQVRTDVINAENQAALAREELVLLTGGAIGDLVTLREDFELPSLEGGIDEWVDRALRSNALLQSKELAVSAARSGVEEGRGSMLPTVELVLSWQRSDVGFDNLQLPERDIEYIGVDVTLPLFAGGANSARLREAWSNYYVAREEEEGARRELLKRVRSAWLNASAGLRRLEAAELGVESAQTRYAAVRKALDLGTARTADLLEALHGQTLARRDYRQALYAYVFHWVALQRESGELTGDTLAGLEEMVLGE